MQILDESGNYGVIVRFTPTEWDKLESALEGPENVRALVLDTEGGDS